MSKELNKLYFFCLYFFISPLIRLIIINFNNFISLFSEIFSIFYLSENSNFITKGIMLFIIRSILFPFERIYFIYNILFKRKLYWGFDDILFSEQSIIYSQRIMIFIILLEIIIAILYPNNLDNNNNNDNNNILFPELKLIKKILFKR